MSSGRCNDARTSGVCSTAVYASTSSSRNGRRISRSVSSTGALLPTRDGGDDAQGLAVGDGRVDALQKADVLVGKEHVDEAPEATGLVEQSLGEARVRGFECLQRLGDGAGLDLHFGGVARE